MGGIPKTTSPYLIHNKPTLWGVSSFYNIIGETINDYGNISLDIRWIRETVKYCSNTWGNLSQWKGNRLRYRIEFENSFGMWLEITRMYSLMTLCWNLQREVSQCHIYYRKVLIIDEGMDYFLFITLFNPTVIDSNSFLTLKLNSVRKCLRLQ